MAKPAHLNVDIPAENIEGHYADFAGIWHTSETFVLDFMALTQPSKPDPDEPDRTVRDARMVSRVRMPAAQVWEIMKALEHQYTAWEIEQGKRQGPAATPQND